MSIFLDRVRNVETPDRNSIIAATRRKHALNRITELGIHSDIVSRACSVSIPTYKRMLHGAPMRKNATLIALDRMSAVMSHMEVELGLSDSEIKNFIEREPLRHDNGDIDLFASWDPDTEAYNRSPLITRIADRDGLFRVEQRLGYKFYERYDSHVANS